MQPDELTKRTQSAPLGARPAEQRSEETLKGSKSFGSTEQAQQAQEGGQKLQGQDVSLKNSFGILGEAAMDVIKEGPVAPKDYNKMIYEGRSMERKE